MKRTALQRTTPLKRGTSQLTRRTKLRPMSAKREAERLIRKAVRVRVLARDKGRCQLRVVGVCTSHAVDVHEVRPRGRGGDYLDPDNCVAACRACHDHVHNNPAESLAAGRLASGHVGAGGEYDLDGWITAYSITEAWPDWAPRPAEVQS
ncbi:MAG: HNH endonuclease signature motif containing protein [Planctomycetota bacterium]